MLNKYLLQEARPSRPKKIFQITALISLLIIAFSTGAYFTAAYLPAFKDPINNFRVSFLIIQNYFDLSGVEALKMIVVIPLSCLGALIGSINLIRITNRKPFLSVLHVLPGIGVIVFIIGCAFIYLVPSFVFNNLPVDYSTKIPYFGYAYGALIWVGGIVIADIFAFFYPVMNYTQFHPVYKAYHQALRHARTNTDRSRIRHYFYYYWKKKRYDDILTLLFIEKSGGQPEKMDIDSYVYFRDGALEHMSEEKAKELDELYETEQYDILNRELAMLSSDKSVPPKVVTPEVIAPVETKPVVEEGPKMIEVDDTEEELNRYGKKLQKKGRSRAMIQARKEKARAERSARRSLKRARHS